MCEEVDCDKWLRLYKKILLKFNRNKPISSIYFGGGTPSLLPPNFVSEIIKFIKNNFNVDSDVEITMEANPGTIDIEQAWMFKDAGVNRLSIGIQSIYDEGLKILGRNTHSAIGGISCVNDMVNVFDNVSIDLIYNRPRQTPNEWRNELLETIDLFVDKIQHISCYELIVEEGTKLYNDIKDNVLPIPLDTDEFLNITHDVLEKAGFEMYEVSNFAMDGEYSRHNSSYWKYEEYYGVGPGAHSRIIIDNDRYAIAQEKNTKDWIAWAERGDCQFDMELLSKDDILKEKLIMGLRSKYGVGIDTISAVDNYEKKIISLEKNLYIMFDGKRIIMTFDGLKRLNLVISYMLGGLEV